MYQFKKTAIALAAAQIALLASGMAFAQADGQQSGTNPNAGAAQPAPASDQPVAANTVVVTGQRAALNSAQSIKRDSDEIVDSIVADDIGKLPDRSVTEVLQRVVGVTIDHTMSKGDPEHFSVEGSGVTIRGLSYVRSELNGRDSFSANGGRALNFDDVPPELLAGVDIYKDPSAEQIEGAIGGLVNLRTALPFDFKGRKVAATVQDTYSDLTKGKRQPTGSIMYSDRWKTPYGEFGFLVDVASSESRTRTDGFQVEPYYARTDVVPGSTVWVPKGAEYRTLMYDRKRQGTYLALQWKKDATLNSSLTYFRSKYRMQWDEQAIFSAASPYNIQVANGTYGSNGQLLTGTLSDPTDNGIGFGADTRSANRRSSTTDISWHTTWRPSSSWQFDTDLQHVAASSSSFDSTVATGVNLPSETLNLGGSIPAINFDASQTAYLANPNNYYWQFTQEHFDNSHAGEWAWKNDAKFTFDDPVLRDIRFGVRLTRATSLTENSNPSYNWAAITEPWQGELAGHLAYLGDPRFANQTQVHSFSNFFGNNTSVPALVFPNVSLATGYPSSYATLHGYYTTLCQQYAPAGTSCTDWTPATFGTDPAGTNDLTERTAAFYSQLRFGWDNLKYPVDGNIGLRYVQTLLSARGYSVFNPTFTQPVAGATVTGPAIPNIAAFSAAQQSENNYHNVLPSLNLRMKATDKLQFRFAAAMGISKPDYSQLQSYATLSEGVDIAPYNAATNSQVINSVSLTGTGSGNPQLRPTQSRQFDLSAEWYFAPAGSLTFAVFNKKLKDIIVNQSYGYNVTGVDGNPYTFTVTGPVNGASGHARGAELAYQQYFDKLPGWLSGFGVQANYTYVDSRQDLNNPVNSVYCSSTSGGADNLNLNMNGCDTNGTTFTNLPLQGLSKQSYNLALLYDQKKFSARLAYSWRSKYLQAVNVNGTNGTDGTDSNPASPTFGAHNVAWALPTYADSYGTLDGSLFYHFTENLQLGIEAHNLSNTKYRQLMQQQIGFMTRAVFATGRSYAASLSYSF